MEELGRSGGQALGIQVSNNMVDRLRAYTRAVSSFPCAVKEASHKTFLIRFRKWF